MRQPVGANGNAEPVVIGGMVLDIQASPVSQEIQAGTTSPGEVFYSEFSHSIPLWTLVSLFVTGGTKIFGSVPSVFRLREGHCKERFVSPRIQFG
jgi:hypothetical protein